MTFLNLVVFGLATWRMASLLAEESGPFDVFMKMRKLSGIIHDPDKIVAMIPDNFFAQMISCVWCNSIYIGAFWATMLYFLPEVSPYLAFPLALSAITIICQKRI